jgi:hypothetical protein
MKDDVNDEVPNETPKILILFNGLVNWDGVLKSSGRLEGDHATHFEVGYKDLSHIKFRLEMLISK